MTRITKKQLPHHYAASRVLRSRKGLVTFSILVAVSLIGFFTHTKNDVSSTNSGESEEDIGGDFEQIIPRIGEVMPLSWKADRNLVTPNAYRVSLPPELLRAMKEYCDTNGLTELARHYILSEENNISPGKPMIFHETVYSISKKDCDVFYLVSIKIKVEKNISRLKMAFFGMLNDLRKSGNQICIG